ncbi:MAG: arsenate reductase [Methylophaga sp.]|nr:MAG: arsenate reductase [Methylophaga sp.]
MDKIRVLFLCTGNACRSQMAEGWAKELASDLIKIKSACIEIHGKNQYAINTMAEVGIDISAQESIRVNGEMLEWSDVLVTLCDNAEEQCPVVNAHIVKLHLPIADPAKIKGTEKEILAEFCEARDKIKSRVEYVLEKIAASH